VELNRRKVSPFHDLPFLISFLAKEEEVKQQPSSKSYSSGNAVYEFSVKNINCNLISDYVEELELFYFYIKVTLSSLSPLSTEHRVWREGLVWIKINSLS